MSRLRDQRGYTAFELLFASTLFVALLVAAFGPMDRMWGLVRDNERQNESQEVTRRTVDRIVTELRSAGGQDVAIEKAGANDIVFGLVNPNPDPAEVPAIGGNETGVMRVRYCLDGMDRLLRQEQRWSTAARPQLVTNLCPENTPWASAQVVLADVNNAGSPVFTYNDTPCEASVAPALVDIDAVGICVGTTVPVKDGERETPTQLSTVVAVRNEINGTRP